MEEMDLIAVRIKDGIFAGNIAAAEDREFLSMNKITHIINCAGGEVADLFVGDSEFRYLSFPWKDVAGSVCTTVLFDSNDENVNKAVQFIDEAMSTGDCVLVHSYHGVSRSPALIAAYFIVKYGWKLESALSFLQMAHPDGNIKPHFLRQLRVFAKRHQVERDIFDREVDDSAFGLDNDQWMLRNTLLNGLAYSEQETNELFRVCATKVGVGARVGKVSKKARISFIDTKQGTNVAAMNTTPVVSGKSPAAGHADPNATGGSVRSSNDDNFVGSQGPAALRSGRRSPSILSRSTSPCSRRLESDSKANPKGRQTLQLVSAPKPAATPMGAATLARASPSRGSNAGEDAQAAADASTAKEASCAREGSLDSRVSYYERLAPPKPKTATKGGLPVRSPLATLTSKHKYRNGSPLPLKDKQKGDPKVRTKISSSPLSRPASAGGAATSPRGPRSPSAAGKERTGSPAAATSGRGKAPPSSGVTREANSRYVAIAPQRSGSANGRSAWKSTLPSHERPSVTRPLSPAYQSSRSPAPRPRSTSVRSRTSSPGDKEKPRKRSTSKTKKRTGSPGKAGGSSTPSKAPSSPNLSQNSNASFSSSLDRSPSTAKKLNGASSSGKLRRQPPAAIPSRRQ